VQLKKIKNKFAGDILSRSW